MDLIRQMLEGLEDPQMRHAIIVHMPVALAFLGLPLVGLTLARPKSHLARWTAIIAYAVLTVAAYFASESGHDAEARVSPAISAAGGRVLEDHEYWGERAWWVAAGVAVFLLITAIPKKPVRLAAGVLAIITALVMGGWIAVVGHWGGTLVYEHGAVAAPAESGRDNAEAGEDDPLARAIDPRITFFQNNVLPIFRDTCWGCHNPNRADRFGGLDLTSIAAVLKGGDSAPNEFAVVPGHPERSLMVEAVRYDGFLQMPPSKAGGKLADEQIAAIERWVAEGAVWSDVDLPETFETPDETDEADEAHDE